MFQKSGEERREEREGRGGRGRRGEEGGGDVTVETHSSQQRILMDWRFNTSHRVTCRDILFLNVVNLCQSFRPETVKVSSALIKTPESSRTMRSTGSHDTFTGLQHREAENNYKYLPNDSLKLAKKKEIESAVRRWKRKKCCVKKYQKV